MKLRIYKSLWGMSGSLEQQFKQIADAGIYDGIETSMPAKENEAQFRSLLAEYKLDYVPMVFSAGANVREHITSLRADIVRAMTFGPIVINAHGGKDWFTAEDQATFVEGALAASNEIAAPSGVLVGHETHRGRVMFTPVNTAVLLRRFPGLRLNADFSHWTCVCEALLDDQPEAVKLACERSVHIHGRVGHQEGPQVSDPRAPEFADALAHHEAWWDAIVAANRAAGREIMTFTPEFGPPTYMPSLPYTRQPLADLWDICAWMTKRFRARFEASA
ncbi:MAG: sugar phosphate isomerase/epimerase [Chloroflexi bacterium]|nr:sugar phosphate isomerase/epimerase [Chloroflexota bacterium]